MKTKIICLLSVFTSLSFHTFAQVPADSLPLPADLSPGSELRPESTVLDSATDQDSISFTGSLLSDPEELALIEGLDEPMERLRLRDQDTNMILDMF